MAMNSSTRNCYLCNKPLADADYCAIQIHPKLGDMISACHQRIDIVGVHDECIKIRNRMLSRAAFLRAAGRRIQSKSQ
jgi:hypothetical protein